MAQQAGDWAEDRVSAARQSADKGDHKAALEQVESVLKDVPDNVSALLLKAELLLETDSQAETVGKILLALPPTEASERLRKRAEARAIEELAKGRRSASRDYARDAIGCFDVAVAIYPFGSAIPLAAAQAIHSDEQAAWQLQETDIALEKILAAAGRASAQQNIRLEAHRRYLALAFKRGDTADSTYEMVVRRYVRALLIEGKASDALDILDGGAPILDGLAVAAVQWALISVLTALVRLLRAGNPQAVVGALQTTYRRLGHIASVKLLYAEALCQQGEGEKTLSAYRSALRASDARPLRRIQPSDVRQLMALIQDITIRCPGCGTAQPLTANVCAICDTSLRKQALNFDPYPLEGASDSVFAHLGIAMLLAKKEGELDGACRHLDAALALLPEHHASRPALSLVRETWRAEADRLVRKQNLLSQLTDATDRQEPSIESLSLVKSVCEDNPELWAELPVEKRLALVDSLIKARQLVVARSVIEMAFPGRDGAGALAARRRALKRELKRVARDHDREMRSALTDGHNERASELAERVLAMDPVYLPALLVRGQAKLQSGQAIAALADLQRVIEGGDPDLAAQARLGAAKAFESQGDFEAALAMLGTANSEEAATIARRIERRRANEPFVLTLATDDIVMHDTLRRASDASASLAVFAVVLRMVSRTASDARREQYDRILNAHFEFVRVLGGLRNAPGDPLFALRIVSQPHEQIPERGALRIALLARVTAGTADAARELGMQLWLTLRDILPSAQEHTYVYEPVSDEDELKHLLEPFASAYVAEIVRREDVPQQDGDSYAVYPFVSSSLDLHNLCWALLRQKGAALLSIHLLPTDLMAWERAALHAVLSGEDGRSTDHVERHGDSAHASAVATWWHGVSRWGKALANRQLVDSLGTQVYVLRITVAGSAQTSPLLPEILASAMLGSGNQASGIPAGGYTVITAQTEAEQAIAQRNLSRIDVEQWVYSAAPERVARIRHLVGDYEAAVIFRLPLPGPSGVPGIALLDAKPIAPPADLPARGTVLDESVTRTHGGALRIRQSGADRRRHMYVVGKTGVGKSTLLENLVLQDIEAGHGVCLVDPHGDLVEEVLLRIPPHRVGDVILFDPSDEAYPIGLNLLDARSEGEKHRIVTEFIGLLARMYDPHTMGIVGPRFQHNVRNAMLTVMAVEGSTLIEVVRALTDIQYVQRLLPHVTDPLVLNYWQKQIAQTSDFHKSEVLDWIVSKFSRFVGDRLVRNIIGQRKTTLDFRSIMDRRRVLLVNLSKGKIGPENAQFLGLLLVQSLLITALSRADVHADRRPDFYLYVDEFQNFATELFATILSEGRKYGIAAVVANQYLTQLDTPMREAIFGNVGSLVCFRVGIHDAPALAPEMYPVFGADDLLNLPRFVAAAKLLVDGLAARPFTMRTLPDLRPPNRTLAEAIRQESRRKYGRDANAVTQDVLARFRPPDR